MRTMCMGYVTVLTGLLLRIRQVWPIHIIDVSITTLALVFVPLSFISSLFGMKDVNAPGGGLFWVYFAVAVPVTLLVYLVARPPGKDTIAAIRSSIFAWSKKLEEETDVTVATTSAEAGM